MCQTAQASAHYLKQGTVRKLDRVVVEETTEGAEKITRIRVMACQSSHRKHHAGYPLLPAYTNLQP